MGLWAYPSKNAPLKTRYFGHMPKIDHFDPASWPVGEDHKRESPDNVIVNTKEHEHCYSLDSDTIRELWAILRNHLYTGPNSTSVVITIIKPQGEL
jgi:hypothetical protein